ncbi:MAG: hypothetical protein R3C68_15545 [Myxococcota bacterium]
MQLAHAYSTWTPADYVVLSGSGTYIFAKLAVKGGVDPATLIFAEGQHAEEVFEAIVGLVDTSALVVGLGNIGGVGLQLASYFANRSERL